MSHLPRTCRQDGGSTKRRYHSKRDAKKALVVARSHGLHMHVYRCPTCEFFHLAKDRLKDGGEEL